MLKKKTILKLLTVIVSFSLFTLGIILLARDAIVTPQLALLMMVALFGLYVGFGILIAVYRLVVNLE